MRRWSDHHRNPGEAEVRATYERYNRSLLDRDFATTCAILTEDAAANIAEAIAAGGGPSGLTCVLAFEVVYGDPSAASRLDEAARSLEVESVEVAGDRATVVYSGSAGGRTVTGLRAPLIRIDGQWRVEGTS